MARFVGRITRTDTQAPISDLVVRVYSVTAAGDDHHGQRVVSLGSDISDASGRFQVVSRPVEGEPTLRVLVTVARPDRPAGGDGDGHRRPGLVPEGLVPEDAVPFDAAAFLLTTPVHEVAADAQESYRLSIDGDRLEQAGVLPPGPSTSGLRLSTRARRTIDEAVVSEVAVGEAIADRVVRGKELEAEFETDFLPRFLEEVTASSGAVAAGYQFVVGPAAEHAPGALARKAIERGVARMQAEGVPDPDREREGRRRTRFFFDQAQLQQLDNVTTANGTLPAGTFGDIGRSTLMEILGLTARIETSGTPVEVAREDKLFEAFLQDTAEERSARDLLAGPATTTNPQQPGGGAGTPPGPADANAVLELLGRTIEDIRSPIDVLTGDGEGPGLATKIREFAVPVGPADEPRVFDFATLDVAFEDVWQTVVDTRLEPLARSLHVKMSRVLKDRVVAPTDLADLGKLTAALRSVRAATQDAAPTMVFLRNDGRGPRDLLGGGGDILPVDPVPPRPPDPPDPPDPPGGRPDRPPEPGGVLLPDESDGSDYDTDANPEDLVEQINAILKEPHAFTAFGADGRSKAVNFGLLIGYRHVMTPVSYQVGDLVKSITLAPNEVREYKTRTVITRKRSEKELMKRSAIRRDEFSETNRAESEIIRKALAKTNFSLNTNGTYNIGISKGDSTTASSRDGETNSGEVKKAFREAVLKASEELRQERAVEVTFDEGYEFEETTSGRLENKNSEITLNCLFFELQRRFRVNETIQKATPVILVAQDVPAPDEINNGFLVRYAWVIRRALLDDGFEPALDYVQGAIVGDRLEVLALAETLSAHRLQVRDLTTQMQALEEQAGRRYEALVQAVRERIAEEGREESDGFFSDIGQSLFGGGQDTETAKLREEAARDAEQRAAEKAKEMAVNLQRAVNALNEATEAYNKANRRYQSMALEVARLRLHVKEHILHYMQAIWVHEVEDQRFLRLYQLPVPQFANPVGTEPTYRRLGATSAVSRVDVDISDTANVSAHARVGVDFELVPSIEMLPDQFDLPLVEVADPSRLLGFLGNYMIFPMRRSNALTDMMLDPYVDEGLRLLDPHDPGNITRPQFAEYVVRLRERLGAQEFESIRGALAARYRELLLSSEYAGDEIVVPSGALYMEALPGSTPLLEGFKLAHRALDLVRAQEDARRAAIENLRHASRLIEGRLDDPETDARYDFYGAPGVVTPTPPNQPSPGGGGGANPAGGGG
ncbi:hypothetical protein ISU10_02150 [Nocardioides agariphilus]|jgi:hypothetical protein|uniref:Uncharacterized protein n=1 Tax=Nocardioides agariphilus TaxID=433664 RepID=A0A930VL66_9ACTN|nr:hypothetical protein [Nocardioides agariphilus]MBF4766567.1 hypothetical protein [Nocardioides agariphilus]